LIGKGGSHWALRREENTDRILWYCNEADTADDGSDELQADTRVDDGLWHHVAGVYDGSQMLIYVDGRLDASVAATRIVEPHPGDAVWIGGDSQRNERFWTGLTDDMRVYNRALTVDEIKQAMRGDPDAAWDPSPANSSISDVLRAASMSWSPGDSASQHAVYFSTDRDAVAGADTSDTTGVFRGLQAGTSYTPPEGVEWAGGPYYWRISRRRARQQPRVCGVGRRL
ncbi:MAG: LamG domain-containing protein, partial [Planctomycetota bacterium]